MLNLDGTTILIVDDEETICSILQSAFSDIGSKAFTATSGIDAIEIYKNNKIDCVISDIRMPKMDGIKLSKEIQALNRDAIIYLISGFSDYTGRELDTLGIEAIIFKPFDIEEVVETVYSRLQEHS